ncbi:MAG: glycine zipper family protein [Gammaproteobacteria bacterium]
MKSFGMLAIAGGFAALALGGCAEVPTGPTVAVWPGPGKPFSVFQEDDAVCRQYASYKIGNTTGNANNKAVQQVAIGTAVGALAGLLIGDSSGGVGVGAGVGLLAGGAAAANSSGNGSGDAQNLYNIAYQQCMYSRGNQIPGAPPPAYTPPPPPPPAGGGGS